MGDNVGELAQPFHVPKPYSLRRHSALDFAATANSLPC